MALCIASWRKIQAIDDYKDVAGKMLFRNLFMNAPESYALFDFRGDPISEETYQSEKFLIHARGVIGMVDTAVDLLERGDMDTLSKALQQLGARHVGYKVEFAHYSMVGQALLQTLEAALGEGWSEELKEAWEGVYGVVIAEQMQTGAENKPKGVNTPKWQKSAGENKQSKRRWWRWGWARH